MLDVVPENALTPTLRPSYGATPRVMGVINLSPQSFYNASPDLSAALIQADAMVKAGAAIIDVGAVATNPFVNLKSSTPSIQSEIDCLIPFIEALSSRVDAMISVDTSSADVMHAAVNAGAHMINDQCALMQDNALSMAVKLQVPVCLMHHFNPMRQPGSSTPDALFACIKNALNAYAVRCLNAGLSRDCIILDPGFGGGHFGKSADENFYVLAHLTELVALGFPLLVGLSRKSMFADIAPSVDDRLYASVAAATIAAMQGAAIIRVHDVKATVDAMKVVARYQCEVSV